MKIERVETFQADAGWRMFSFLKVTTDDGIIGWSEFNESFGSIGLSDVIRGLSPVLIGRDPRRYEQITQHLHVLTRQSRGGINQQAIAAIENALLDVTGKAYGVPVYALFGGPIRDRIPVYWSHFGTYRVRSAALMGVPALNSYDDLARHAEEVKRARLPRAEDQHHPDRERQDHLLRAWLRPHAGLAGTELGQQAAARAERSARGNPRRGRAGDGHPSRHQLQLQDRRLQAHRRHGRAVQPDLAGDRHARRAGAGRDQARRALPDRVVRDAARPARVQAVLRQLRDRRGDRRRDLERAERVAEDRLDGRRLRDQRARRTTSTAICAARSAPRSARSCRTSASWRSTSTARPGATNSMSPCRRSRTASSSCRKVPAGAST